MSAFRLDRANAKLMGVCAGLASSTGVDPTLVRIALLMLTLILGPVIVLAYFIAAWAAN